MLHDGAVMTRKEGYRAEDDPGGEFSGGGTRVPQPRPKRARRFRRQRVDAAHLSLLLLPSLLAVGGLLLATASSRLAGSWERPWEIAGWALLAAVAALHQPFPGRRADAAEPTVETLGLGTLVLPAALLGPGAVPAALLAGAASFAAGSLRRRLLHGTERVAGTLPALEGALLLAASVLLAALGVFGLGGGDHTLGWIVGALLYLALLGLARAGLPAARRGRTFRRHDLLLLLPDAGGWAVGIVLARLAVAPPSVGWLPLLPVYVALALVAAEAARHEIGQRRAGRRLDDFERLTEAHGRILGETSGIGGIAQQVLSECRHIVPVQWFQLELPDGRSWAAGPDGVVVEGRPEPPPRPRMLPGIHRRVEWRRIELPLLPSEDEETESDALQSLATVRLWCDPRRIEEGSEELLWSLVPQMASSLERSHLDREARLDPLTGVPVRRRLEGRLHRAFRRACREGRPLALVICDVDHFKRVNDTWGHPAGDEALRRVAAALDGTRRDEDLLCRWGGEEFTLLLEHTDGASALRLAERMRRAVEAIELEWEGEEIPLTLSLGVASFPELMVKAPGELVLLADEALYAAKERGRNQSLLHLGKGAFRAP